jgi:hypothetical protein
MKTFSAPGAVIELDALGCGPALQDMGNSGNALLMSTESCRTKSRPIQSANLNQEAFV